jgi:hypothetical protein
MENIKQKFKTNPLLFYPDAFSPMVPTQLIEKGAFLRVQSSLARHFRLRLEAPERPMARKCLPIYEQREGMRGKSA